MLATIS